MSGFFIKISAKGKVQGPFNSSQLKKLVAQKKLKSEYLISQDKQKWSRAEKVKGLFPADKLKPAESEPDLIPEPEDDFAPQPESVAEQAGSSLCHKCGEQLEEGAVVCMECGYNSATGKSVDGDDDDFDGYFTEKSEVKKDIPDKSGWLIKILHFLFFLIAVLPVFAGWHGSISNSNTQGYCSFGFLGIMLLAVFSLLVMKIKLSSSAKSRTSLVVYAPVIAINLMVIAAWNCPTIPGIKSSGMFRSSSGSNVFRLTTAFYGSLIFSYITFVIGLLRSSALDNPGNSRQQNIKGTALKAGIVFLIIIGALVPKITKEAAEYKLGKAQLNIKNLNTAAVKYADKHAGAYPDAIGDLKDFAHQQDFSYEIPGSGRSSYRIVKGHRKSRGSTGWLLFYENDSFEGCRLAGLFGGNIKLLADDKFKALLAKTKKEIKARRENEKKQEAAGIKREKAAAEARAAKKIKEEAERLAALAEVRKIAEGKNDKALPGILFQNVIGEFSSPAGIPTAIEYPDRVKMTISSGFTAMQINGRTVKPKVKQYRANSRRRLCWIVFRAGATFNKAVPVKTAEYLIALNEKEYTCLGVESVSGRDDAVNFTSGTPVLDGKSGYRRLFFEIPKAADVVKIIYRPGDGKEQSIVVALPENK